MSWEQRNIDFCNAQTNAQMTYIEAEREVVRLEAENTKLRELVKNLHACNGSCPRCIELMGRCEYEEQLREFGIEASE